MSELKSLKNAFVEILLEDKSLLAKSDELIRKIEPLILKDTSNMRSFQTLQRVLNLNIGENILAAMENEARLEEELKNARRRLQETGMQDGRIDDVLELIEGAVSAIKIKKQEESFNNIGINKGEDENGWICTNCGTKNTSKFCQMCGTSHDAMPSSTVLTNNVNNPPNQTAQQKKSMSAPLIAVIAVIGTLIAGFAIQYVIGQSKTPTSNLEQAAQTQNEQPAAKVTENKTVESPKPIATPKTIPTGEHWICDTQGVYLWNPEPTEGESITWSGGYMRDGDYKFAHGAGTVTWYRNGKIVQVDEGGFSHGMHHGKFIHKFPSGKVMYSNWDHGRELK